MPALIFRRNTDCREVVVASRRRADTIGYGIAHIADDRAEVAIAVEQPRLGALVPLLHLLVGHRGFLILRQNLVIRILIVVVTPVEIIEQLVVVLDELLDVLDELLLILCDRHLCRRAGGRRFLKGIGDAVDLQLVVLQIRIGAAVNLDARVRPRHRKSGGRARRRKRERCADRSAVDLSELQIIQESRRICCRTRPRIHGKAYLIVAARLRVHDGEGVGHGVVARRDVKRRLLAVAVDEACIGDARREIVEREILRKDLLCRELDLRRARPVRELEAERRIAARHARGHRAARKGDVLQRNACRCRCIRTRHLLPRRRHQIGVRRRLRDLHSMRHHAGVCIRRRRHHIRERTRRRHRLRPRAQTHIRHAAAECIHRAVDVSKGLFAPLRLDFLLIEPVILLLLGHHADLDQ